MSTTYDPRRFRRLAAAAGLIGFPVLLVVHQAIDTSGGDSAAKVDAVLSSGGRVAWGGVLLLLSAILTVPAAYGVVHLLRDRGARLGHWGGTLLTLGALGHTAIATHTLLLAGVAGGDRAEMIAFLDRADDSPAVASVFPLILSFALGALLCILALRRGGFVGVWAPVVIGMAVLLDFRPPMDGAAGDAIGLLQQLLLAAAFVPIGVKVARLREDEWSMRAPTSLPPQQQPAALV